MLYAYLFMHSYVHNWSCRATNDAARKVSYSETARFHSSKEHPVDGKALRNHFRASKVDLFHEKQWEFNGKSMKISRN